MDLHILSLMLVCILFNSIYMHTSANQQQWILNIEADTSLSFIGAEVTIKHTDSILDCSVKCVEDSSCCKASYSHSSKTCLLDTSYDCSGQTIQSSGSSLLQLLGETCKDIYTRNPGVQDGKFLINAGTTMPVFCVFKQNVVYTFLSKNINLDVMDIHNLYTTNTYALIRNLNTNGVQKETIVRQMTSFVTMANLSFTYNSQPNYKRPVNIGLAPYLYLGFLPIGLVNQSGTLQGYSANNTDYTFTNCDGNPNSYIVFYYNPSGAKFGSKFQISASSIGTAWIDSSTPVDVHSYMDDEFFFQFEIRFGGCGAYMTSDSVSGVKAALGLPSALP